VVNVTYTERRQPGDLGCIRTAGPLGVTIRVLQFLNGTGFRDYEHVRVYLGGGQVLQAEAGGATVSGNHVKQGELWSTGLFPGWQPVTEQHARDVARQFEGVPYSYLDYLAITGHRLHFPNLAVWPGAGEEAGERVDLQTYISDSHHEICSQLGDSYELALGRHLFADDRWPGYVTPGDLSGLFLAQAARLKVPILGRDYGW
jgi:hypothetical protein